jgi:tetratricopeptide (TPR) repeat protein
VAIDREKTLQAAAKLVDKKKYDKAIAEYQKVVQSDPGDARTLLRIGDLQSRIQDYGGAVATYDQVARFYAAQGFHLKAIAVFKQIRELIKKHAPELSGRYSHVLPKLAEIYAELGLTSDALIAYDEVAAQFQASGRDRDAIAVFQKTVRLDPKNPLPHLRLAEANCKIQDLDAAIDSFWTAAGLLLELQRPDDALKVVERILTFRPEPLYARAAAELFLRRNTSESGMAALARLQLAFQANPKDLDTLSLLAQAFEMIGQPEKALAVHIEMARLARDQNKVQLFGEIMAHLRRIAPHNDQVMALERLGPPRTASQPPQSLEVPVSSAWSGRRSDPGQSRPPAPPQPRRAYSSAPPAVELQAAEEELEEIDEEEDDAVDLDTDLEYIEEVSDRESRTSGIPIMSAHRVAIEEKSSAPPFQPATSTRKAIVDAEAFQKLGLLDKAVEALHIALEMDPNSIPIREKLREILVDAGEREAAIEETLNIAIIHLHNQDVAQAHPLIQEVLEIEPEHPDALNLLAHVHALQGGPIQPAADGHLDSYDLEGVPPSSAMQIPRGAPLPTFAEEPGTIVDLVPPSRARPSPEQIEEVLEEAEFFASQGLYEDAIAILEDTLKAAPGHVLLNERLDEVRMAMARRSDAPPSSLGMPSAGDDAAFALAASLDALDDFDHAEAPTVATSAEEVDVDQVFAKFKEGIKATVDDSDAATHYDLGVAYKEMGLLTDAQSEFELASRDPDRATMCHYMIGAIHRDLGDLPEARASFLRALKVDRKTPDQEKALEYDLGLIYESLGDRNNCLTMFKAIYRRDQGYRDVEARIRALGGTLSIAPGDEDAELDRALNNLFG